MILTLIGNKTDLSDERAVSRDEAYLFATSINGNYLETSTVTEQGIEQVFMTTALGLLRLAENRTYGSSIKRYESVESVSTYCSSLGSRNPNFPSSNFFNFKEFFFAFQTF